MLSRAKISCHHGDIKAENQLLNAISIIHQHPDIDILEIDFVCINGEYVSSHDYDEESISKGSTLEKWVQLIIKRGKILWIDLKDNLKSLVIPMLSQIDVPLLLDILGKLATKHKNLTDYLIIGCQYDHVYKQLITQHTYTIIRDLPLVDMYVLDKVCIFGGVSEFIINNIKEHIQNDVIALDRKFFATNQDIVNLIETTMVGFAVTFIIYNFEKYEDPIVVPNKHIIHQYNYQL